MRKSGIFYKSCDMNREDNYEQRVLEVEMGSFTPFDVFHLCPASYYLVLGWWQGVLVTPGEKLCNSLLAIVRYYLLVPPEELDTREMCYSYISY